MRPDYAPVRDRDIGFDASATAPVDHLAGPQHDVIAPTLRDEQRRARSDGGGAERSANNEITT